MLACALPWLLGTDAATLDPVALGATEGAVNACTAINPDFVSRLRDKLTELTQGASEQQLREVRNGESYRKAYDLVQRTVSESNEQDAKRFCSEAPAKGK